MVGHELKRLQVNELLRRLEALGPIKLSWETMAPS